MPTALLSAVVVLLALILASLWAVLYQLVKQQGRLLLRLDDVERRLGVEGSSAGISAGLQIAARADRKTPAGLPVGTPLPSFRVPDLTGRSVALEGFQG